MDLILNLLIICALAMLLLTVAAAVTAVSDVRSRTRMRRSLDELIRERP